mmetsp:Transcript_28808/g.84988  ORF Transcript_28808/g.84988 Transcript_28808/m.84988 type:complete len:218 (+) Transcript_28808:464-1117(+)
MTSEIILQYWYGPEQYRGKEIHGRLQDGSGGRGRMDTPLGGLVRSGAGEDVVPLGIDQWHSRIDLGRSDDVTVQAGCDHGRGEGDPPHHSLGLRGTVLLLNQRGQTERHSERRPHRRGVTLDQGLVGHLGRRVSIEIIHQRILGLIRPAPKEEGGSRGGSDHGDAYRSVERYVSAHAKRMRNGIPRIRMEGRGRYAHRLPQRAIHLFLRRPRRRIRQ